MLIAYHGTVSKAVILKQLRQHAKRDELGKGQYWHNGKGCAVGCTIHSRQHVEYETRFGIPQMLARLEDCIFEGLPNGTAKAWPVRFMTAVQPGTDLSLVGWQFLHWLLTDKKVNPGIDHPLVHDAVKQCADVLVPLTKGMPVDSSAARSAASAARSAESAARSATRSATRSAGSAGRAAAWSAESAATWSPAWRAESAGRAAKWSAESAAARSAGSVTWTVARSAAYILMADKLVALIKTAPKVK